MLHSKATAALLRLKEIDRKYKIKQENKLSNVSTESISDISITPPNHVDSPAKTSDNISRAKLDIQMPEARIEVKNETVIQRDISKSEESSKMQKVQESYVSEIQSNEENEDTSIEEVIATIDESGISEAYRSEGIDSGRSRKETGFTEEDSGTVAAEIPKTYKNDTFEDVSSSFGSKSRSLNESGKVKAFSAAEKERRTGDSVKSKRKEVTPPQSNLASKSTDSSRDKQVVELVAPKLIDNASECEVGLDKDLSNYVKTIDSMVTDPNDLPPVCLLKSPKSTPRSRRVKKKRQVKPESSVDSRTDSGFSPRKSKDGSVTKTKYSTDVPTEISSSEVRTVSTSKTGKDEESNGNASVVVDIVLSPKERKDKTESTETEEISERENEGKTDVTEKSKSQQFSAGSSEDHSATRVLRKLNRDALNAMSKRHKVATDDSSQKSSEKKASDNDRKRKATSKEITDVRISGDRENVRPTERKTVTTELNESDKVHRDSTTDEETDGTRGKEANVTSRTARSHKATHRREEEYVKFDKEQMSRLQKRLIAFRIQQEREEFYKFLRDFRQTRPKLGLCFTGISSVEEIKPNQLKPLEFPKIAEFSPDSVDQNLNLDDYYYGVREKILTIRQWLKDQYTLYRDYSALAQTLNARYVPATLEDAKKTIRELRETTIKAR